MGRLIFKAAEKYRSEEAFLRALQGEGIPITHPSPATNRLVAGLATAGQMAGILAVEVRRQRPGGAPFRRRMMRGWVSFHIHRCEEGCCVRVRGAFKREMINADAEEHQMGALEGAPRHL